MKETIKYYYNVYPDELFEIDNGCYFYYGDFKFYFVKFDRDVKDLDLLVKMSNDLYEKNILVDTFIKSKDNSFFVKDLDSIYVLLRVNYIEDDVYNLKDIVYFNNLLISNDNLRFSEDWAGLWMKKVDELELEVSEVNMEYPLIQESFSYYVGLAENAILYFKDTLKDESLSDIKINLNHNRIREKVYSGFINNPLTFTFDYEVRDVSEYIKSKFFHGDIDFFEVEDLIITSNYSKASLRLLFSRLLYPSYYFDSLRDIFINDNDEEILKIYIDKVSEYEEFLVDVYNLICKRYFIPPIEWLVNK